MDMRKVFVRFSLYLSFLLVSLLLFNIAIFYSYNCPATEFFSNLVDENEERKVDESNAKDGALIYGPYLTLSPGNYEITFYYETDTDANFFDLFSAQYPLHYSFQNLYADENKVTIQFQTAEEIPAFEIRVFYSGIGMLSVQKIRIFDIESYRNAILKGNLILLFAISILAAIDIGFLHLSKKKIFKSDKNSLDKMNIDLAWFLVLIGTGCFLIYFLCPKIYSKNAICLLISGFVFINFIARVLLLIMELPGIKIEQLAFVSILIIGTATAVMIPPFRVADETSHYVRAYSLSCGHLIESVEGAEAPAQLDAYTDITDTWAVLLTDRNYKYTFKQTLDSLSIKISDETIRIPLSDGGRTSATSYSFVNYVPHIIAIWICRIFHLSVYLSVVLGRIFNVLIFGVISYYSIKLTPVCKTAFSVFLIVPMLIHQAAGYSGDSILVIATVFLVALCLNVKHRSKPVTGKENLLIIGTILVLGLCKPPYVLSGFLVWIIPKNLFQSIYSKKRIWIPYIVYPIVGLLVMAVWQKVGIINRPPAPSPDKYSMIDVLKDPIYTAYVFLANFMRNAVDMFFLSLEGVFSAPGGVAILRISTAFLVILFILDRSEYTLSYWDRCIFSVLTVGIIGALQLVGFIWTVKGNLNLSGLQGRYFLPAVLTGGIAFFSNTNVSVKLKAFEMKFFSGQIFLTLITMFSLYIMHYV